MTRSMSRLTRRAPELGILRVEDGEGGGGGGAEGGAEGGAGTGSEQERGNGSDGNKPISEMTDAERAAYFERKSNRMRDALRSRGDYDAVKAERDRLKQAGESDTEKAVREAREAAKAEGRAEALRESSTTTVKALLQGALTARSMTDADIQAAIKHIDPASFITDGEVDHDAIVGHANRLAGAPTGKVPDLGQGRRGDSTSQSGISAGREMFATSRGKK